MSASLPPGPRLHESTAADALLFRRVLLGLIIPGAILTTILLILYAYAAWKAVSRKHLDRVSFRLLVHALVAHLVFCISFPVSTINTHPGIACEFQAFFANGSLMYSAGMFFCVAVNLPLVLSHKVNGQRMEKFYIAGVATVCLACNITPLATGRFGLNPSNFTCWYRDAPGPTLLKWVLSTQTVWLLFTSAGEVTSFAVILMYLVGYELEARSLSSRTGESMSRMHPTDMGTTFPTIELDIDTRESKPPTATFTRASQRDRERTRSTRRLFRGIVLRIGLYPLASCMLNISTSVMDWHLASDPMPTEQNWRINLADLAIYCSRPLIYGLLAATDPSFVRAMRALCHSEVDSSSTTPTTVDTTRSGQRRTTRIWWPRALTRTRLGTGYPSTVVDVDYGSTTTGLDGCEMDVLASTSTAEVGRRKSEADNVEDGDPRTRPPRVIGTGRSVEEGSVVAAADADAEEADWEAMGRLVSQM